MKKIILAVLLLTGLDAGTSRDLKKGCSKGNITDCHNLGLMYQRGEGVLQSSYWAAKFFKKACHGDKPKDIAMQACYDLGFLYYIGKENGLKRSYRNAFKLFSKACDGGNSKSCNQLGIMYLNGEGTKQNQLTAKRYFKSACDLGNSDACKQYETLKE
jgi:uncharacterized protein